MSKPNAHAVNHHATKLVSNWQNSSLSRKSTENPSSFPTPPRREPPRHQAGKPKVVTNADAPYIKMVSEQFDRCHGTLLQYVEFLCSAVTPGSAYAQLIPSLHDLVHLYHLDPEVAFLIYRPVMRLFKCQGSSDVFWPLDDNDATNISNTNLESELTEYSGNVVLDLGSPRKPIM
uniref:Uncharacterized protein n=1 Tax=Fagus sylvatica TaxID=28930 RepID=A0A2N9HAW9_FAGSY